MSMIYVIAHVTDETGVKLLYTKVEKMDSFYSPVNYMAAASDSLKIIPQERVISEEQEDGQMESFITAWIERTDEMVDCAEEDAEVCSE